MIREIIKDEMILCQKSSDATSEDISVGNDLIDTLEHNKDGCVGLAANMIGVLKRIIVVDDEGTKLLMFNPEIIKSAEPYSTEEGCLSLVGTRPTKSYKTIKVE